MGFEVNKTRQTMNLAPIIAGGSSLLDSIMNQIFAKRNTDRTIRANKQLANYQYQQDLKMANAANQFNIDMWNRQNVYNSPAEQMKRLQQAGLNPNLVYGSGNVGGNVTSGPPRSEVAKYQKPTVKYNYQPPQTAPAIQSYFDARVKQAQTNNLNATTLLTDAKTVNEATRTKGIFTDNEVKELKRRMLENTFDYQVQTKEQELEIAKQKLANMKADNEIKQILKVGYGHDNVYRKFKAKLANEGININDGILARQIAKYMADNNLGIHDMYDHVMRKMVDWLFGK